MIQPGYAIWEKNLKVQRADGAITLIKSRSNVIVDTGLPKDQPKILQVLKRYNLSPSDIQFVICTHGDADHTSNNNLFPNAKLVVGFDIYDGDRASFFQKNFKIDSNITVTEMTGHDDRSIGVLVKTKNGLVAITGDLFEYRDDWKKTKEWLAFSKRPKRQIKNRAKIWELADFIVPEHGDIFRVDKSVDILREETKELDKILRTVNVYGDVSL